MKSRTSSVASDELPRELAALSAVSVKHLKYRWRAWYEAEPPRRISKELLTRALAYQSYKRFRRTQALHTTNTRARRGRPLIVPPDACRAEIECLLGHHCGSRMATRQPSSHRSR
jgi:hypothetical protein